MAAELPVESSSNVQPPPPPPPPPPAVDSGGGFNYNYYRRLHVSLLEGDWETAEKFFNDDSSALTSKISIVAMTPLLVAAMGSQWKVVEKLVQLLSPEALAVQDMSSFTALHYVALGGNLNVAKTLVRKNHSLTQVITTAGETPLHVAVISCRSKEFIRYLASVTTNDAPACPFSGSSARKLLVLLTAAGFHDITLDLLQLYPDMATNIDESGSGILNVLSKMPSEFPSGSKLGFWERLIYRIVPVELDHPPPNNPKGDMGDLHGTSSKYQYYFGSLLWKAIENLCMLLTAATTGVVELLKSCLKCFPELIWVNIPKEGFLVQIAIRNRQEKVFNLLCNVPISKTFLLLLDDSQNSSSHIVARLPPSYTHLASIPGTAFQMQRELQWFKEVEKMDHPLYKQIKNKDEKTPWELFREEHKGLLDQGEKWMKDTSDCCMLVSTLIATVAFAAVFTLPGGNNQEKGFPIFLNDKVFLVFAVSDALALFSSITSLFMFFSILTARYAEEDFLKTLPNKLILGLIFLFCAIATTTIAFGAAFSLVLRERLRWVAIPVTLLAFLSIALFAVLQLPLFLQMVKSTYGSGIYHPQRIW